MLTPKTSNFVSSSCPLDVQGSEPAGVDEPVDTGRQSYTTLLEWSHTQAFMCCRAAACGGRGR